MFLAERSGVGEGERLDHWTEGLLSPAIPLPLQLRELHRQDCPSKWIAVAVGTTSADCPPHRSLRARLRIRLLPRRSGGEAGIGIRVQNTGFRNPLVQDWGKTAPSHLCVLTATDRGDSYVWTSCEGDASSGGGLISGAGRLSLRLREVPSGGHRQAERFA